MTYPAARCYGGSYSWTKLSKEQQQVRPSSYNHTVNLAPGLCSANGNEELAHMPILVLAAQLCPRGIEARACHGSISQSSQLSGQSACNCPEDGFDML